MTGGLVGAPSAYATEHPSPERKSIMAKKAPNYSPELTDAVVNDYLAGKPVKDIADAIGKSVQSVRSKLVREGVYVAQEKPQGSKRDNGPTKKAVIRDIEAALINTPAKLTKVQLLEALNKLMPQITAADYQNATKPGLLILLEMVKVMKAANVSIPDPSF